MRVLGGPPQLPLAQATTSCSASAMLLLPGAGPVQARVAPRRTTPPVAKDIMVNAILAFFSKQLYIRGKLDRAPIRASTAIFVSPMRVSQLPTIQGPVKTGAWQSLLIFFLSPLAAASISRLRLSTRLLPSFLFTHPLHPSARLLWGGREPRDPRSSAC